MALFHILNVPNAFRRLLKTTMGVEWWENQTPLSPLRLVVRDLLAAWMLVQDLGVDDAAPVGAA